MPASLVPSLNTPRIRRHGPRRTIFRRLGPGLFLMRSGVPLYHFIPEVTEPGPSTPSRRTGDLIVFFEDKIIVV
jgi:hypothetical protein